MAKTDYLKPHREIETFEEAQKFFKDKLDLQLWCSIKGYFDLAWPLVQELEKERPHCRRCAFNRGWYHMIYKGLQDGMDLINQGRIEGVFGNGHIGTRKPLFDGTPNKTILLVSEGGFGDEIINIRFAKTLKEHYNSKVIVSCHPGLAPLFSRVDGVDAVVTSSKIHEAIHFDYWLPAMSAVSAFPDMEFDTLPRAPFLTALPEYKNKFTSRIQTDKLKVGVKWYGNQEFEHEQFRRFPPQLLFDAVKQDHVQLYSLQKERDPEYGVPDYVVDLGPELKTWEDTLGVMANLDLVISSCTSVPHASSALGIETWVVPPVLPYYIWSEKNVLENRPFKSAWYENTTVFRQTKFGDWSETFNQVKEYLRKFK